MGQQPKITKQKLEKSSSKSEIEMERLKMAVSGTLEQAEERYQVDLVAWEFEREPDFDSEKTGRKVSRLRKEIEALGAVNMVAMEEYEKLSERFLFINSQEIEDHGLRYL